jgi:hypothetical protein
MERYPHLIEAQNNTNRYIETPSKEWNALKYFFGNSHKYILYQDNTITSVYLESFNAL